MVAGQTRHVLITGASSGLGAALAGLYSARSYSLTLFGRDAERLAAVGRACAAAADVTLVQCDVADAAETERQVLAADDRRPIDVLIANAGVGGSQVVVGPAGESLEQAVAIARTNFLGVINTLAPLVPRMVERRRGQIVLMGSLAGFVALPQSPVYSATKAAVHTYGEGLRRRLASAGVAVTVVAPGFVETPMSASLDTPRPFLWSAERAATYIARGIDKRRRMMMFPWQFRWALAAARFLPTALIDRVLAAPAFGSKP